DVVTLGGEIVTAIVDGVASLADFAASAFAGVRATPPSGRIFPLIFVVRAAACRGAQGEEQNEQVKCGARHGGDFTPRAALAKRQIVAPWPRSRRRASGLRWGRFPLARAQHYKGDVTPGVACLAKYTRRRSRATWLALRCHSSGFCSSTLTTTWGFLLGAKPANQLDVGLDAEGLSVPVLPATEIAP